MIRDINFSVTEKCKFFIIIIIIILEVAYSDRRLWSDSMGVQADLNFRWLPNSGDADQ